MDEHRSLLEDPGLFNIDETFSYLAQVIQPFSADVLEDAIDERTPALVCLSMSSDEEFRLPNPEADDTSLGAFLQTWRRGLLRAVYFMGPAPSTIDLDSRETPKTQKVPLLEESCSFSAPANTILLFRPDLYDYACSAPAGNVMLVSNFLSVAPQMAFGKLEGDVEWLTKNEGPPPPPGEAIHVMNAVTRLPGFWDSAAAYYAGLRGGTDSIVQIPLCRWDVGIYWTADESNVQSWQTTTRHQSFVEGAEFFDNKYFEISTAEASGMDPVQRLVLECGAQSLAMIGLTKKDANRKSTHAGFCVGNDKLDWMTCDKEVQAGGALGGTSTVLAMIANRFSFVFNLKGPNFVCDTACSASLTSTHCAKYMISDRKNDPLEFFLTMGAHLCLSGGPFIGCSQAHMSSPKGRCFTFNSTADGYLRGEGVSGYMMKWGDYIGESYAILRATACGQDGRSASLTAPNGPAQEEMITRAIREAGMTPPESTVWECHGTGTSLGDPIEVGAVRKVQVRMKRSEPLMIGSSKTNIGHLEGGAAMAGMVKCILQCKHSKCQPTLHLRTLNPHLEHAAFDAVFETEPGNFAANQGHSQVSSFGFGGTNAHGIFWGRSADLKQDVQKLWLRKLLARPPPEVRPMGKNYDDWEADFPDVRKMRKGAKFQLSLSPLALPNEPLRWDVAEESYEAEVEDDEATFAIIGNFCNWDAEQAIPLEDGDVPGLHVVTLQAPSAGNLEFQILHGGNAKRVIGPSVEISTRRSDRIIGPEADLQNKWVIEDCETEDVRIEFFSRNGRRGITWVFDKNSFALLGNGASHEE